MSDYDDMQARVVTRVTITARPAAVFKYLTNLQYHYLWNPHLRSISPLITIKSGSAYQSASLILGIKIRATNVVTKLVPNQELELENNTGQIKYQVSYRLEPKQSKTVVSCSTTVIAQSNAFAFAKPVLKMLARRELQADLQLLKLVVEQGLK